MLVCCTVGSLEQAAQLAQIFPSAQPSAIANDVFFRPPMADMHSAAKRNDVNFIEASAVVDAIFFLARLLGRRLALHAAVLHRDDVAACCSNSTRTAATSIHAIRTPLRNSTFSF